MRSRAPPGSRPAKSHIFLCVLKRFWSHCGSLFDKKSIKKHTQKTVSFQTQLFFVFGCPRTSFGAPFWRRFGAQHLIRWKNENHRFYLYILRFGEVGPLPNHSFFSLFPVPWKSKFLYTFLSIFVTNGIPAGLHFSSKSDLKTCLQNISKKMAFYKPVLA